MTWSLHLNTCNLGTDFRLATNPFTGESIRMPLDIGLTDMERSNVRELLSRRNATSPDPDGYRRIKFPKGGTVSIAIGTLDDPHPCRAFAVEFEEFTPEVAAFVFDLARRQFVNRVYHRPGCRSPHPASGE
jgi:hypothetical protein